MRDYRKAVYGLTAFALVNLIVMFCLIPTLPDSVPVHLNHRFEVDRMGSAWMLAIFPAIAMLCPAGIAVEQRLRGGAYANNRLLTIFAFGFSALFIALGWVMLSVFGSGAQLGDTLQTPIELVIGLGVSMLFIIMGNYLPTVRQNRTLGIRIRATLENAEIWRRVHRFGGPVMVAGGMLAMVVTLIGHFSGVEWLVFAGLLAGVMGSFLVILIYAKRLERGMKE